MADRPRPDQEELRRKYEELKKEIQIGIDQLDRGESAELDFADIMRRARAEVARINQEKRKNKQ
ncbi:MAG TPA: hypothetical protein VGF55_23735 [Gemmataceae bacterium]|jgi:hypothetical protein